MTVAGRQDSTPLLMDLVEVIKENRSLRPNKVSSYVQTEEAGEAAMSLEQKLKRIDTSLRDAADTERLLPFTTLEERLTKYKRELELKYQNDLEGEVRRLREFELSKIRIEEAQRYRTKVQEYRDELEALQQEKLRELKIREQEAWDRIKNRERDIDKQAFELRQRQIRDEEVLRARENETKKTLEVELLMARNERDTLAKSKREDELRLKDLELQRIKLDKEHVE